MSLKEDEGDGLAKDVEGRIQAPTVVMMDGASAEDDVDVGHCADGSRVSGNARWREGETDPNGSPKTKGDVQLVGVVQDGIAVAVGLAHIQTGGGLV